MHIKTACEAVVFLSSSGHCSLSCSYCIVNPIAKHEPSLNYEDIRFLLQQIGMPTFLACSGKGDFFAGYGRHERLLEKILSHEVELALDINGVLLQEFAEISTDKITKIKYVNLTMHYRQLLEQRALKVWRDNALLLLGRLGATADFLLGFVLSPLERDMWSEAIDFYRREIFAVTAKKLVLIKDLNGKFSPEEEHTIENIQMQYPELIEVNRLRPHIPLQR